MSIIYLISIRIIILTCILIRRWSSILGTGADYVYLPDEHILEFPEVGLQPQSVRLKHGSIGILLSLNF